MPIGSKDDELDTQELGHGTEWLQVLMHADPKHSQGIQTQGDARVVQNADPEISRGQSDVTFLIGICELEDDSSDRENWLEISILQDAPFDRQKGVRVRDVYFAQVEVQRPRV